MISAAIASVAIFLSGIWQSDIILESRKLPYKPTWWIKVAILLSTILSFLASGGYFVMTFDLMERSIVQTFWLRPIVTTIICLFPVVLIHAKNEREAHAEMLSIQDAAIAKQKEQTEIYDTFVRTVSHELRTPLSVIKGFSELLIDQEHKVPPDIKDVYLGYIHHQAENMHYLIKNILHFQKWEKDEKFYRLVQLDSIIDLVVQNIDAPISQPTGVKLSLGDLPSTIVWGHAIRLELVFNNLITNAIKFSSGGTVFISLRHENGNAIIDIRDTGIGIDESEFEKIFLPFYQTFKGDSRLYAGVGLGLAVAKDIIIEHGGTITVKSQLERGSTFTVSIPMRDNDYSGNRNDSAVSYTN